ncbi:unnamed protein product [Fraxinus pennsylvanica]|uniref:Terpene synthase metal-binding domain-containing protein n=1 Tax=Fraxinus pennsylvanica TaxID=56036 RepID=A0AAD1YTF7_9LAMI|nr:unnamed protein product [Fraxinus pennsylvanica]
MQTKVIAMLSVIDDIYDIYGTLDELTLLMDAIEREIIPCSLRDRGDIGELVSKEAFEWVASDPLILQGSEIIGRLMNNLFEQKTSAVGCYMNQNNGASKEEAFAEIQKSSYECMENHKPRKSSSCCANGFPRASYCQSCTGLTY